MLALCSSHWGDTHLHGCPSFQYLFWLASIRRRRVTLWTTLLWKCIRGGCFAAICFPFPSSLYFKRRKVTQVIIIMFAKHHCLQETTWWRLTRGRGGNFISLNYSSFYNTAKLYNLSNYWCLEAYELQSYFNVAHTETSNKKKRTYSPPVLPCFLIFAETAVLAGGVTSKVSKSKFARGGT